MTAVRTAGEADANAIYDVHRAAIEARGPAAYDDEQVAAWASRDATEENYGYDIGAPGVHWVVAERTGDEGGTADRTGVVGFGRLSVDETEISAVYVHPDAMGEGVGTAILAALEGYARGVGLSELSLLASLNAVGFYERAGYVRVRDVVLETGGVELDCVEMGKRL